MKMTRLEWRYLQRIALDHPYYDTHKPPLSDAEAKAIMEANNTMTGREFVDSIYAKLGMTRPVKEKKRLAWLSNIGELFAVPPIRKIAIAILVVLLMTVFFAATPTGRAIAESVIQYIVTLFDDGSLTVNQNENNAPLGLSKNKGYTDSEPQCGQMDTLYLSSFEEFTKMTGKKAVILPLPYTELFYEYDEVIDYLTLYSIYESINGKIVICQIWDSEGMVSVTQTGYTAYNVDESIYYSIEENGDIYCMIIMEDSILNISSTGNYSLDKLIEMLKANN